MRKIYSYLLAAVAAMALAIPASAQKLSISGRVLDATDGQPLIGAGVMLSNGVGTVTDYEGKYVIQAEKNATLTFSSLGYVSVTEAVNGRTVINVSLSPDTEALEEVVVLGYTTQKKTELSSAVVSMSGDKLTDVASADIGNMLQGKVAGVVAMNASGQPGAGASIRIRGTGSITAGADPMYVVDGVAGGDFNPNDVETISVLKDASATALYGAAAAGGVIVVTTKSAKQDKPVINFKASYGIKKALTGRFKAMDSEELYYTQKQMYSKMIFPSQRPESLLEQDFDWVNNSFRLGNVQNYYGSVSGRTGRTSYYVSLDHYNENGTLVNTNYKRTAARVNLSTAITDRVTLNTRINYKRTASREESSYVTLECAYRALPWDIPYVIDEDGNITDEVLLVNDPARSDNGKP
ncbi:MAG: TonB-dependent receptor plug domain-containing protein, partial [Bacteroidales bacterium]|nr:TonB-dependent receptor plug domain-containing protein [Bacteroidales bacterium]